MQRNSWRLVAMGVWRVLCVWKTRFSEVFVSFRRRWARVRGTSFSSFFASERKVVDSPRQLDKRRCLVRRYVCICGAIVRVSLWNDVYTSNTGAVTLNHYCQIKTAWQLQAFVATATGPLSDRRVDMLKVFRLVLWGCLTLAKTRNYDVAGFLADAIFFFSVRLCKWKLPWCFKRSIRSIFAR